jgi:SAM-dependent methyltransferase
MQELLMLRSCFNRREQDISILDYGMGWGAFCEVAKTMNFSICGHDLSSIKRDHVRARGIRVINELSDLPPESLDFINLEQVIEHVAEPRALVQKLTSYLKTGGIMKISVPHQSAQMRYQLEHLLSIGSNNLYDKIMEIWPLSHINCFTRAALIRGLHNAALPVSMPLYPLFLPSALNAITSHFKTLYGRPLHEIHPGYLLRMSTRLLYKKYYPGSNYLFFKKIR